MNEIFDYLIQRIRLKDRENYEPFFAQFYQEVVPTISVSIEDEDHYNKNNLINLFASLAKFVVEPVSSDLINAQILNWFKKDIDLFK